jgi:hypothetical protein
MAKDMFRTNGIKAGLYKCWIYQPLRCDAEAVCSKPLLEHLNKCPRVRQNHIFKNNQGIKWSGTTIYKNVWQWWANCSKRLQVIDNDGMQK